MPVPKKKRITSTAEARTVEFGDSSVPDEQEFRHRMRNLAINAMQVLIGVTISNGGKHTLSVRLASQANPFR